MIFFVCWSWVKTESCLLAPTLFFRQGANARLYFLPSVGYFSFIFTVKNIHGKLCSFVHTDAIWYPITVLGRRWTISEKLSAAPGHSCFTHLSRRSVTSNRSCVKFTLEGTSTNIHYFTKKKKYRWLNVFDILLFICLYAITHQVVWNHGPPLVPILLL